MERHRLNQFALDIEFLLISVVQGVALAALATTSVGPLTDLKYEYWFYILSGFLLILNFWSQAIVHAVSFIDWPISLEHSFLYFAASFVEVMAFSNITHPVEWFGFICVFLVIVAFLYWFDLKLIKRHEKQIVAAGGRELYLHVLSRQLFEFKYFVPSAIIFNVGAFLLIQYFQDIFIAQKYHIALAALQALFTIAVMVEANQNFRTRAKLISKNLI